MKRRKDWERSGCNHTVVSGDELKEWGVALNCDNHAAHEAGSALPASQKDAQNAHSKRFCDVRAFALGLLKELKVERKKG